MPVETIFAGAYMRHSKSARECITDGRGIRVCKFDAGDIMIIELKQEGVCALFDEERGWAAGAWGSFRQEQKGRQPHASQTGNLKQTCMFQQFALLGFGAWQV